MASRYLSWRCQASERGDSKDERQAPRAPAPATRAALKCRGQGLAAFASTSDAQRLDDLAMSTKQVRCDRGANGKLATIEPVGPVAGPRDASAHQGAALMASLAALLGDLLQDLEKRLNDEIEQLKQKVEAPKISEEENMDRGILEEGEDSSRKLGIGSFNLDFVEKSQEATSRQQALEVASLETKLAALTRQQDDRALHLEQELKRLQQQLFEAQVAASTAPAGGTQAPSETASALATTLSNHEQEPCCNVSLTSVMIEILEIGGALESLIRCSLLWRLQLVWGCHWSPSDQALILTGALALTYLNSIGRACADSTAEPIRPSGSLPPPTMVLVEDTDPWQLGSKAQRGPAKQLGPAWRFGFQLGIFLDFGWSVAV
eukprot:Skav215131  [mRNA]  locus=scaffold1164:60119:66352:- [translate_table: standard]